MAGTRRRIRTGVVATLVACAVVGSATSAIAAGQVATAPKGVGQGFFEISGRAGDGQYFVENWAGDDIRLVYTVPPWIQGAQDEAGFSGVNLSPGGDRFVTVDPDLGLEVANDGRGPRRILARGAGADADVTITPIWSPDGRDLAVATQNSNGDYSDGLYIVRADGSGSRELLADGLEASANAMAWSPDGDEVAVWTERPPAQEWGQSTLEVLDLLDHSVKKLATVPASRIPEGVYWGAAGRLVVLLADNNAGAGGSSCGCEIRQIPATGGRLQPLIHKISPKDVLWRLSRVISYPKACTGYPGARSSLTFTIPTNRPRVASWPSRSRLPEGAWRRGRPWPSLVAHGLSAAGATWSPNGTEIALDKGGSLLVLSRTRLLSTVRAPNDSVVEWAPSHPSGESTFDRRWH